MSNPYRPDPVENAPYSADPYASEPAPTGYAPATPVEPFPGAVTDAPPETYSTTQTYLTTDTSPGVDQPAESATDVAKGEAADVKDTAVDAAKNVAATTKDEAANVAAEAGAQAKSLLGNAGSELKAQASTQQTRIASTLSSYSTELRGMAQGSSESGPLTDLAHQAAEKVSDIASWLENREPADVLDEVRRFARRRPVMFLALCAVAGVAAGRVTRGAVAANTEVDSPKADSSSSLPATGSVAPAIEPVYETPAAGLTPTYDTGSTYATGSTYGSYTDAPVADQTTAWTEPAPQQTEYGSPTR